MRLTRVLTATAVATAALFAAAAPASAHPVDVLTTTTGSCPAGYAEIAQVGSYAACLHLSIPDHKVYIDGTPCPSGYAEYSVLDFYRVCIDFTE